MWESVEQDSFVFPNIVCYRSDESGVESGHFLPPSCFPEHTSSFLRRNTVNFLITMYLTVKQDAHFLA